MSGKTIGTAFGGLTRDAELKYTNSGAAVLHFTIANSEKRKVNGEYQDVSQYWDVEMWGQRAEGLAQYLTKGKKVAAWGTMRQERWDQEGVQRMKVVLTADGLEFTGSAENGSGRTSERTDERNYGQGAENRSQTPPRQAVGNSAQPAQAGNQADDLFTDDIPF